MSTLLHDVRYTLRLLRRSPGFAVTALTTLALVIGANTAIFSAVRGILLAPLPYRDADRLVRLFEEAPATSHFPMAPADFRDYRAELQTFEAIAAYGRADLQLGDAGQPEHLRGIQVSAGFFGLLGYTPALGREFVLDDELEAKVMAQGVSQRRHEFGVRQALGATRADIVRLVFSSGAVMTLAGLVAGVGLAIGATPLLASLLYGVSPLDRVTFAVVAALLIAAAACATYLPARRATRISAASALRGAD